jgi:xylan 1,4-beta-xylosidase
MIRNPILPGFNPDPSIVRVGEDYYIATSTFEWFPGVQIHHSRDLVNWRLIARPLNRPSQLNMLGAPDSCGVWAPCLTHADGLFHLIYTDVKRYGRTTVGGASGASLRDFHNYLVTCETIDGDWSDPVFLNSSGFDPSLFHDDDGRKWLVNMLWDHRPDRNRFAGIVLQEYSHNARALAGERKVIFEGTSLGLTEAPHLYKRDGWYYLLTAEGGTGWNHAATMARSRDIAGPYVLHPDTYILSSRTHPETPLQRAGHADLVETPDGQTYGVYLCGRPLPNRGRCVLGRETAIQPMVWGEDGWLRTVDGKGLPSLTAPAPNLPPHPFAKTPVRADFYDAQLPIDFQPQHFQQAAGLACYYGGTKFHYLHVTHDETHGRHLRVMSALPDAPQADAFTDPVPLPPGPIQLRVEVDFERLRFAWSSDGKDWRWLPETFDASILSDEATAPGLPNFTGAFVGVACQDMSGACHPADFDWFNYRERDSLTDPTVPERP